LSSHPNKAPREPRPEARDVWYADGVRFECQLTGRCCTNHGEHAYVYLKPQDERRLARHFQISLRWMRRRYTQLMDGWRILKNTGTACIFLDGKRCSVHAARPVQCRTWPFWRENLDPEVWRREVIGFCAGVGRGRLHCRQEIEALARAHDADR